MASNNLIVADLITSEASVPAETPVKDVLAWFKEHPYNDFLAITQAEKVCGLVGREALNARLAGNKFNEAIFRGKPVSRVMNEKVLAVESSFTASDLVRKLMDFNSSERNFYDDIVVNQDGKFIGLASVKQLIFKQMMVIHGQAAEREQSQHLLAKKNQELAGTFCKLAKSGDELFGLLKQCSIPVLRVKEDGLLLWANAPFYQLTNHSSDTLSKRYVGSLFKENSFTNILKSHRNSGSDGDNVSPTYILNLKDGKGNELGVELALDAETVPGSILLFVLRSVDTGEATSAESAYLGSAAMKETQSLKKILQSRQTGIKTALKSLDAIISLADQLDFKGPNAQNLGGTLGQFSVVDLVQLLIQSRKSGELEVVDSNKEAGYLYLQEGMIIHAFHLGQKGKPAVRTLMTIPSGTFQFHYDRVASEVSIEGSDAMGVLMEACAEMDEAASA